MDTHIYVCALSRLEDTVRHTGARFVVTAINPWSIPDTPKSVAEANHLKLAINDIDEPHPGLVHPEARHIEELIAFAERWNGDGPLVIHCLAGISRSSASAFISACALNPETDENIIAQALRSASQTARPNPLMIELADDFLGRGGRMMTAIETLSDAIPSIEAEFYRIPSRY